MSSDEEDIDSIEEEEEEVVVVKKTRRKKKKNQDPNRPKRNMSAFFLYSNAHRERIKQEQPEAKFGDIVSFSMVVFIMSFMCVLLGTILHIMCLVGEMCSPWPCCVLERPRLCVPCACTLLSIRCTSCNVGHVSVKKHAL